MYVAVGYGGAVLTSPTGYDNWTIRNSPVTASLQSIIWQNGLFVAIGERGTIITSSDAVLWTVRPSGTIDHFQDMAFGNDLFVAVATTTTNRIHTTVITSADGISWTSQTIDSVDSMHLLSTASKRLFSSVAWGNDTFVAVGGWNTVFTSPDGLVWTDRSSPSIPSLSRVAYGNNIFVATEGLDSIATSTNGIAWTQRVSIPGADDPYNLQWCNDRFVAVRWNLLMTSPDGIAWTRQTPAGIGSMNLKPVTWHANQYTIGNLNTFTTLTSGDGTDWTLHPPVQIGTINRITYNGVQYLAVGTSGMILTSPDLEQWDVRSSGTAKTLYSAIWDGSQFVVVGESGTILSSSDGITWTKASFDTGCSLLSIVHNGSLLTAVGSKGTIATSADGKKWALKRGEDTITNFMSVAWNGSKFFAIGGYSYGEIGNYHQSIVTSKDGTDWKNELAAGALCPYSAIWCGTYFTGISVNHTVLQYSSDGINWVARDTITADDWRALAWGGNTVMAVSRLGKAGSSSDGTKWDRQSTSVPTWIVDLTFAENKFVGAAAKTIYTIQAPSGTRLSASAGPSSTAPLKTVGNSITYYVPSPSPVTLKLFSVSGRLLRTLVDAPQHAGSHSCAIPPAFAPGTYLVTFRTNKTVTNEYVLLVK
jgi:hypothetical protein